MAGRNGRELYGLHSLKVTGSLRDFLSVENPCVDVLYFYLLLSVWLVGLDNSQTLALCLFVRSGPSRSMTWIYHIKSYQYLDVLPLL